eukprot:gene10775-biopygen16816
MRGGWGPPLGPGFRGCRGHGRGFHPNYRESYTSPAPRAPRHLAFRYELLPKLRMVLRGCRRNPVTASQIRRAAAQPFSTVYALRWASHTLEVTLSSLPRRGCRAHSSPPPPRLTPPEVNVASAQCPKFPLPIQATPPQAARRLPNFYTLLQNTV